MLPAPGKQKQVLRAFGPQDDSSRSFKRGKRLGSTGLLLLFMVFGVLLFMVSVLIERRRSRVQ